MRVQLRDLTPGTEYAIQFRSNNGEEVSEWSQVQRFTTTNDTIAPAPVTNLAWAQSGSSFVATWDKPTTDAQGNTLLDFRDFQLEIDDTVNAYKHIIHTVDTFFALTEDEHVKAFGGRKAALRLTVKVRDLTYNESTPVSLTTSADTPPVPSTPTVGNYLGMLNVIWDGKAAGGAAMPENFSHAEVHIGSSATFTPDNNTYKTKIEALGSASSAVIPGLAYDAQVWVRLVSVSKLNRKSGPSASATGTPTRVSGLDITNGSLSAEQINWTATAIPGQNAYYSTSQPTAPIGGGSFKVNDLWYDTDNGYTVYKWNGTVWVLAPEVGFIPGTKIVGGTITGDRIAANFFSAARAYLGQAFIDEAMIQTVNAGSITTGALKANQRIIAGDEAGNHAEMRSDGFYVIGPEAGGDPLLPPVMTPRVKMGTSNNDFFAIADPNDPEHNLAQIADDGAAAFQQLAVAGDPEFQGKRLSTMLDDLSKVAGEGYVGPISGLNQSGSQGIRAEYGVGQFSFEVEAGRTYEITSKIESYSCTHANLEIQMRLRLQKDGRTAAEKLAQIAPTPVTNSSTAISTLFLSPTVAGWGRFDQISGIWRSDFTGTVSVGLSLQLPETAGPPPEAVLKVADNSFIKFLAKDLGWSGALTGRPHSQGGTLYSWTAPPPPPPPATQQYYYNYGANWVHSYKGNNTWMSNEGGRAYQGTDPSGYNGNQMAYYGFSNVDWVAISQGRIDKIELYLYYAHWYYAAGGIARIGVHSQWGDPEGASRNTGAGPYGTFDIGGWARGSGKWLDVTGWGAWFQNGTFRGIALGPGNNGYNNYGYATACEVRLWVTR